MRRLAGLLIVLAAGCQALLDFAPSASEDSASDASAESGGATGADARADAATNDGDASGSDAVATYGCVVPSSVTGVCPPAGTHGPCEGGVTYDGRCYFHATWSTLVGPSEARAACNAADAQPATFTCKAEWESVIAQLGVPAGNYWMLNARKLGDECTWNTQEPWTFSAWATKQPSDAGECLLVAAEGWVAVDCVARTALALCERP